MEPNLTFQRELTATGSTSQGQPIRARPVNLNGHRMVLEISDQQTVLRISEGLSDFKLLSGQQVLYSGKAVVANVLNTGLNVLCDVSLDETRFDAGIMAAVMRDGQPCLDFNRCLAEWQKLYVVRPEFKIVVSDLQTLLTDIRLWLEQVEMGLAGLPEAQQAEMKAAVMRQLDEQAIPPINHLHRRFEEIVDELEESAKPAHQSLTRRQLHSLFLCSPFGHRSYAKPLGYAGDYEMVNMIMRSPYEGPTLFAQVMNVWLLRQFPSEAHRNRIKYLTDKLIAEAMRLQSSNRPLRVFNLGCGPAHEIQAFLRQSALSDNTDFTLFDFNEETIQQGRTLLEKVRRENGRGTHLHFQKRSVLHLLKEAAKPGRSASPQYDFIYCAGLFDYLPDRTCQQLMTVFYDWLAPGGLLVATNVFACRPFRHMLEFILDWHLIYRDPSQMLAVAPEQAAPHECVTCSDPTGTNLFLEVRKPSPP